LLEPVMKVETVTPGDYLGDVIGDMNRRRGTILEQVERGTNIAVVATIPLSEMFGYIGQLRSMTRVARASRWSSRTTIRCRRTSPTKSSPKWPSAKQAANA
jgi:translation elongation factor EF-4